MSRTHSERLAYLRARACTLTCECPLNDVHRSALGLGPGHDLMQLYHLRHSNMFIVIRTRVRFLVAFIISLIKHASPHSARIHTEEYNILP